MSICFGARFSPRSIAVDVNELRHETRVPKHTNGFAAAAMAGGRPVGFIGLSWRQLPEPVPNTLECFVDIIEVGAAFRRQGIARKLLEITEERERARGTHQIRAWSAEDKTEAIPMWRALGFGLSPAVEHFPGEEVHGFFVTKTL